MRFEPLRFLKEVHLGRLARSLWQSQFSGWVPICFFTLWYFWWCLHLPSPAKAATVLAVIAGIVAFRVKPEGFEKVLWAVLLVAYLILELHAIDRKDFIDEEVRKQTRREEELRFSDARKLEEQHFREIGQNITGGVAGILKQGHQQFRQTLLQQSQQIATTMRTSDAVIISVGESLSTMTGGDSFAYLTITNFDDKNGTAIMAIQQQGRYPLLSVGAKITDVDLFQKLVAANQPLELAETRINLGDMPVTSFNHQGFKLPYSDRLNLNVFFNGLNGFWTEIFRMRRIGDRWVRAIRVTRQITPEHGDPQEKMLYERVEKDFPMVNGKVDWR